MRIAIAGAGIAGLTAAIALARCRFPVEVYERTGEPREVGAGIQLSPNAMAILARLGLVEQLAPALTFPEAIEIRNGRTGRLLKRLLLGEAARRRYGAPYALIHRADLQSVLLREARSMGFGLHFGTEVEDATSHPDRVRFKAGEAERSCDLLICADGVFSRLRTNSFGLPGPVRLNKLAWRGTVGADRVPTSIPANVTGLWFGRGAHLVHYPVSGGANLNVVVVSSDSLDEAGALPVADFAKPIRDLAEAVPRWTPWPLNVVDARHRWRKGRMMLIGDAAHAMAPSAAQGGAQAIEDAWALAECLDSSREAEPEAALVRFEDLRRPRVQKIARQAMRNLSIYNMSGPGAFVRDQIVAALPISMHLARLDWIYQTRFPENP